MTHILAKANVRPSQNFGCNTNNALRPATLTFCANNVAARDDSSYVARHRERWLRCALRMASRKQARHDARRDQRGHGAGHRSRQAFRNRRRVPIIAPAPHCEAAALALVGVLAITYSLQAELTFMSMTRGDMVAERASEAEAAQRAEQRYGRAETELAALKPTGTTKSATAAYLSRREALQTELRAAEQDRRAAPATVVADPGATALAAYAGALGYKTDAQQLGLWLPLIGVLALEIGAAFAVVLVRATDSIRAVKIENQDSQAGALVQTISQPARERASVGRGEEVTEEADSEGGSPPQPPAITDDIVTRERLKTAILNQPAERGGSASSSERGLAALIGTSRPTVRRAIHGLVIAGIVAAEATRNGTMLRLVA